MKKLAKFLPLLTLSLVALSSCGYQWSFHEKSPTVCLAPIPGDEEGILMREISLALASQGPCHLVRQGGNYDLKVILENGETETIGFRFDKQDISGAVNTNLVATEGRRKLQARVCLYEKGSENVAFGPYTLSAYADYDYLDGDSLEDLAFLNAQGNQVTVLPFSLGQLEPQEAAHATAAHPLYRELAQKIADAVYAEW